MPQPGYEPQECKPTDAYATAKDWYLGFQEFLLDNAAEYAAFAKLLGDRELLTLDVERLLQVHDKGMQFLLWSMNSQLRAFFNAAIGRYAASRFGPFEFDRSGAELCSSLDQYGFVELPPVDAEAVALLLEWLNGSGLIPPETIKDNPPSVTPVDPETLRKDANIGQVPRERLLRTPNLVELATDPLALGLAEQHLGAPPILIDISAWRSFAGEDGAKEAKSAQHFHYDQDDYRFCKMFIYLTDVDEAGGPHVFVPATHLSETIAARRPPDGTPERADFDTWYFKTLRKSEEDVKRWLGIDPVLITGAPGSRFLVNTEGIHRGCPPETHDRWVLQCVYGISPYTFWKGGYAAPPAKGLSPAAAYAAQLLFPVE